MCVCVFGKGGGGGTLKAKGRLYLVFDLAYSTMGVPVLDLKTHSQIGLEEDVLGLPQRSKVTVS